jgi:hypothetical protein
MATKYDEMLDEYGENHGFATLGRGVVIVGPGAAFGVHSTWYAAGDLEKALEAGTLQTRKLIGSLELDIHAVK